MTETTSTAKSSSHMHPVKGKPSGMHGKETTKHSTPLHSSQNPSSIAASLVKGPSLSSTVSTPTPKPAAAASAPAVPEEAPLMQFPHRKSPLAGDAKTLVAGPISIGKMSYSKAAQSKSTTVPPTTAATTATATMPGTAAGSNVKPAPPTFPDDKKKPPHPAANGQPSPSTRPMTFGNVQLPPRTQSAPPNIEELNQLLASASISSPPTSHSSQLSNSVVSASADSPVRLPESLAAASPEPIRKFSMPPPTTTTTASISASAPTSTTTSAVAAHPIKDHSLPLHSSRPEEGAAAPLKPTPAALPSATTLHANAPSFRPKTGPTHAPPPPPSAFAYYPSPSAAGYSVRPSYYASPETGYYRPPPPSQPPHPFSPYNYPGVAGAQPPFVPGYNAPFISSTAAMANGPSLAPSSGSVAATTSPAPRVSKAIKITDPKTGEAVNLASAAVPSLNKPPVRITEEKKESSTRTSDQPQSQSQPPVESTPLMKEPPVLASEPTKVVEQPLANPTVQAAAAPPKVESDQATQSTNDVKVKKDLDAAQVEKPEPAAHIESLTLAVGTLSLDTEEKPATAIPSIVVPSEDISELSEDSLSDYSETEAETETETEADSTLAGSTLDIDFPETLIYPKSLLLCFESFSYILPESLIPSSINELLGEGGHHERPSSSRPSALAAPPGYGGSSGSHGRPTGHDQRGSYYGSAAGFDPNGRSKRGPPSMAESRGASQSQSSLHSASSRSSRSSKYYDDRDSRRSSRDPRGARSGPSRGSQSGSQTPSEAAALAAVLLPHSEHRWTRPDATRSTDSDRLIRTIKGNLNKLTAENFDRVTTRMIQSTVPHLQVLIDAYPRLEENYKLHLRGEPVPEEGVSETEMEASAILASMIQIIFDKAVDEPNFSPLYAMTCHRIVASSAFPSLPGMVDQKLSKVSLFKQLLLKKCQEEYEKKVAWTQERMIKLKPTDDKKEEGESQSGAVAVSVPASTAPTVQATEAVAATPTTLTADQRAAEEEYQRLKLKRRTLGNISFIGHLYRQGLLNERIIHKCIQDLLEDITNIEEEELECCCKLISTVGSNLDQPKAKPHVDKYFERLQILIHNNKLTSRLRFMIMDLIDLRAGGWDRKRASHIGKETMNKDDQPPTPLPSQSGGSGYGRSYAHGGASLAPPPGLRGSSSNSTSGNVAHLDRDRRSTSGPSPSPSVASSRSSQYSGSSTRSAASMSGSASSSYQILSRKGTGKEEDFTVVRGGRRAPSSGSGLERRASEIPGNVSVASMASSVASTASSSGLASAGAAADNMFSHLLEASSNSEAESSAVSEANAPKEDPYERIPEYVKMMSHDSLPNEELQDMAQESKSWRSALGGTESLFYEYLKLCIDKNPKELERINAFLVILFDVLNTNSGGSGVGSQSLVGSFRRVVETYDDWKADVPKIDLVLGSLFGNLLARVMESSTQDSRLATFFTSDASDSRKSLPAWLLPVASTPKSALGILKETLLYTLNREPEGAARLRSAIAASSLDLEGAVAEEDSELYARFLASHPQFPSLFPRSTKRAMEKILKRLPRPVWTATSSDLTEDAATRQTTLADLLAFLQTAASTQAFRNEPNITEGLLSRLVSEMASGATDAPAQASVSFPEWLEATAMSKLLGQEWSAILTLVAEHHRQFPIAVLNGLSLAFKGLTGPNRKDWLKITFKSLHLHAPLAFPRSVYLAYADDTSVDKGEAFFPLSAWLGQLRVAEEEAQDQEDQEDKSSEESI